MKASVMAKLQRKGAKDKIRETVSAKPVLGKPIGTFKFTLKYADGLALELGGFASEVSGLCIGEKAQRDLRRMIFEQAKEMGVKVPENTCARAIVGEEAEDVLLDNSMPEKSAIEEAVKALEGMDFLKVCRVVLVEEFSNHQKHFLIQVGHLDWLTEYSYSIDNAQWSYIKGLQYEYLLGCRASSLPFPISIWGLGKIFVHVVIPENDKKAITEATAYLAKLENLAPIVTMMRSMGDIDEVLKAKDNEIDATKYGMKKLKGEFSEKATFNMNADIAITGLEGEGKLPESIPHSFGAFQYLAIIGLGFLVGWIGSTFTLLGWPIGFALGNLCGLALISWRK